MNTIKIRYEKDSEYRLLPAQGSWIGHSPNGDLIMDLYVERPTTPDEVTIEVDPPNHVREIERLGERQIRQVLMGFVIRPDVAFAMGEWLQAKAREAGFNPPEKGEQH